MTQRDHFLDWNKTLDTLESSVLNEVASMDSASALERGDPIAFFGALARFAMAAEPAKAEQLLEMLDRNKERSPAFTIAFELYSAHLAIRHEEYTLAVRHAERGRVLAISNGREAEAGAFCLVRGTIDYRHSQYAAARKHFEEAVVAARRASSRELEAQALMNLGLVLKNSGNLHESERLLRLAYEMALADQEPSKVARYELNLANVLIRRGAWREALRLARSASVSFSTAALVGFANSARLVEARAMRLLGEPRNALELLHAIYSEAKTLEKPRNAILALEFMGDCELDGGDARQGREHLREALLLARAHGQSTDLVLECLRGLAASEIACGEPGTAQQHVEESIRIAREQGDAYELGTSLLVLATVLAQLGDTAGEIASLEEARDIAGRVGDDYGRARASYALALHSSVQGLHLEAVALASEALRIAQRIDAADIVSSATEFLGRISVSSHSRAAIRTGSAIFRTAPKDESSGFITSDPRLIRTLKIIGQLAPRRLNILIHGESGTGKELIAQAVHRESGRKGPFVPVNCSAFPGDLIEGELFGHARGAYTGADRERAGLFEHAHNGTLFLDEIGDMPIKAQARLLRALESGEVRRLGENNPRLVDVRIVAATHRDLMTMVGAGEFRLDLYYRLAGYVVELPPLRERREDAKLLIDHYFSKFASEQGKSLAMTPEVRQQLASHSWPGNVRELRLVVERLVSLSEDGTTIATLPFVLEGTPSPRSLPELLEAEEKRRILEALQSHNWNKQRAAMTLGTNRTTLIGKMKRMGIASRKP